MVKYSSMDTFDLFVYDKDGLLFNIDTAKDVSIRKKDGINTLEVEDALIDNDLLLDIFNGKYNNKNLRIVGKSSYRGLDGKDHDVTMTLTIARMEVYELNFVAGEIVIPHMEFSFPAYDYYGFMNLNVEVKGEEDK